jgi:hypothetical protein
MSVRSRNLEPADEHNRRRQHQQIGFLSGRRAEGCFVWLLRLAGLLLIAVSVVGSFYGLQGKPAAGPLQVIPDMVKAWPALIGALAAQGFLSVGQWGARQRAQGSIVVTERGRRRQGGDWRFWIVYLALLALSAALNWIAYGGNLVTWGILLVLAVLAVVGGDALAELVIVVDE